MHPFCRGLGPMGGGECGDAQCSVSAKASTTRRPDNCKPSPGPPSSGRVRLRQILGVLIAAGSSRFVGEIWGRGGLYIRGRDNRVVTSEDATLPALRPVSCGAISSKSSITHIAPNPIIMQYFILPSRPALNGYSWITAGQCHIPLFYSAGRTDFIVRHDTSICL